jgi:O-antigen/teichoic acid export membrane protein
VWSYGSLAVVALSGILINFLVAGWMGAESLGVFTQLYAIYVIAAQVAVMGVHDSAQKHIAQHAADPAVCAVVSASALLHSMVTGAIIAFVIYLASATIGKVLDSPATGLGLALAAPGIALFSINKVLLGILNGYRKMRLYVVGQGIRALGIFAVCLFVALDDRPAYLLGLSFTLTELVLLPFLLMVAAPRRADWSLQGELQRWIKSHFSFGARAFLNGLLAEAYIRVDIIMLGVFLSDAQVGIYSFAAMFIEGLFQVSVVMRTIANPVLVNLLTPLDKVGLGRFVRRVSGLSMALTALGAGLLIVAFPYLAGAFDEALISGGYQVLIILGVGMSVFALFVPVDHVMLQAGRPGVQSAMMTGNILVNVVLNLMLIPAYGLMGAAMATTIAFVLSGVVLNTVAWRYLGLKGGLLVGK